MADRRYRAGGNRLVLAFIALVLGSASLVALWVLGGVSRVKARALSPAGRVEAVCRGWLPAPTEYGVWVRRGWQAGGTHLAQTGSESMGRCRDIVWSPDGRLVVVVNEGNTLVVLDVEARRRLG